MSGLTLIIIHIILQNKQLEMKPVKKKRNLCIKSSLFNSQPRLKS